MSLLSINRYTIMALLVLTSGTIFAITGASLLLNVAFLSFVVIYVVSRRGYVAINTLLMVLILLLSILVIINSIFLNTVDFKGVVFFILRICALIVLSGCVYAEYKEFEKVTIRVLEAIVFFTIPVYLYIIFIGAQSYLVSITDTLRVYFGFFTVYGNPIIVLSDLKRVGGVFYEPGILQFYINILIIYSMFYKRRISYVASLFLLFCTFSIIGYLVCLIIHMLYLRGKSRWVVLICVLAVAVYLGAPLVRLKLTTMSYSLRSGELSSIWGHLSLFGHGINSSADLKFYLNKALYHRDYSSSFFLLLNKLGVIGFVIFMFMFVRCLFVALQNSDPMRKFVSISLCITVLITLLSEGIILSNYVLLYLFVENNRRQRYARKSIAHMP